MGFLWEQEVDLIRHSGWWLVAGGWFWCRVLAKKKLLHRARCRSGEKNSSERMTLLLLVSAGSGAAAFFFSGAIAGAATRFGVARLGSGAGSERQASGCEDNGEETSHGMV